MMRRYKVFNIDEEYRFGGPERRIVNVAINLSSDHDIDTLIGLPNKTSSYFYKYVIDANIEAVPLSLHPLSLNPKLLVSYIVCFPIDLLAIYHSCRAIKPLCVHINGAYQFKSAIAARLAGCKIVWHVNNTRANIFVFFVFQIVAFFCADQFIAASARAKLYFLENRFLRKRPTTIIHAPIRAGNYSTPSHILSADSLSINIGSLGGFNAQKNPKLFAESCKYIAQNNPNCHFKYAASIPSEKNSYFKSMKDVSSGINAPFDMLGFTSDVPSFLKTLDIFIFSTSWEGSPTALWEAMASGLPIVTTDVGSAAEYVSESRETGILIKTFCPREIANAVLYLIANPDLARKFGANARIVALNELTVQSCAKLHSDTYQRFL